MYLILLITSTRWELLLPNENYQPYFFCYLLISLNTCQWARIANYDPQINLLLVQSKVKIDNFWQQLLSQPIEKRQFSRFESDYQAIYFDLKVLLELNQRRVANQESIKQTNNLLTLWQQDMEKHQQQNNFKTFLLKRRRDPYQRLINAMLSAEKIKLETK